MFSHVCSLFFILFQFLIIFPYCSADGYCPAGWQSSSSDSRHCYHLNTASFDFYDAAGICHSSHPGASLVSIHDQQANAFISRLVNDADINMHRAWIGMQKAGNGYSWIDGTAVDYVNWCTDDDGRGDCVMVNGNPENGCWSTIDCYQHTASVCQWINMDSANSTMTPTTSAAAEATTAAKATASSIVTRSPTTMPTTRPLTTAKTSKPTTAKTPKPTKTTTSKATKATTTKKPTTAKTPKPTKKTSQESSESSESSE